FLLAPPPPPLCTLSLHDALPIFRSSRNARTGFKAAAAPPAGRIASMTPAARSVQNAPWHGPMPRRSARSRSSIGRRPWVSTNSRSEEHTSELQSRFDLVCRLLLE